MLILHLLPLASQPWLPDLLVYFRKLYALSWKTQWHRKIIKRGRENISVCWFTCPISAISEVALGQSQEPETVSRSALLVTGSRVPGPLSTASSSLAGIWLRRKGAWAMISTSIRDEGVTVGSLTHGITTPSWSFAFAWIFLQAHHTAMWPFQRPILENDAGMQQRTKINKYPRNTSVSAYLCLNFYSL